MLGWATVLLVVAAGLTLRQVQLGDDAPARYGVGVIALSACAYLLLLVPA